MREVKAQMTLDLAITTTLKISEVTQRKWPLDKDHKIEVQVLKLDLVHIKLKEATVLSKIEYKLLILQNKKRDLINKSKMLLALAITTSQPTSLMIDRWQSG